MSAGAGWQDYAPSSGAGWQDYQPQGQSKTLAPPPIAKPHVDMKSVGLLTGRPAVIQDPDAPLPGVSEGRGLREGLAEYDREGFGRIGEGALDVAHGNFSRGGHEMISGGFNALTPTLPLVGPAAPVAMARGLIGGAAGGYLARRGAESLELTPDQQDLAGDVGGIAGGYAGARAPQIGRGTVRLGARGTEEFVNSKLNPLRILANLGKPADEASALRIRVPGRDLGITKPITEGAPLPENPGSRFLRENQGVYPGAPFPAEPPAIYPGANLPENPGVRILRANQGVYPGAHLPETPTPEQLNPSLVSPSRTLPGQHSPEVVRPRIAPPSAIPPRTGLALPPGPEPAAGSIVRSVTEPPARPAPLNDDFVSRIARQEAERSARTGVPIQTEEETPPMSQRATDAWQESAFGKKPETLDVGAKVRAKNPEPPGATTRVAKPSATSNLSAKLAQAMEDIQNAPPSEPSAEGRPLIIDGKVVDPAQDLTAGLKKSLRRVAKPSKTVQ